VLNPREAWKDKAAYDVKAKDLAGLFVKNFQKYKDMPAHIVNAGPRHKDLNEKRRLRHFGTARMDNPSGGFLRIMILAGDMVSPPMGGDENLFYLKAGAPPPDPWGTICF
jgi:hypothetical protein